MAILSIITACPLYLACFRPQMPKTCLPFGQETSYSSVSCCLAPGGSTSLHAASCSLDSCSNASVQPAHASDVCSTTETCVDERRDVWRQHAHSGCSKLRPRACVCSRVRARARARAPERRACRGYAPLRPRGLSRAPRPQRALPRPPSCCWSRSSRGAAWRSSVR